MYKSIETFSDTNIDGQSIFMDITENGHVHFSTRFEDLGRILNADVPEALDFFRNYAILFSASEIQQALTAFRKFKKSVVATSFSEFFYILEGKRPVNVDSKWGCVKWVK